MTDKEAQEDELLALASIYDENDFNGSTLADLDPGGWFYAHLDLPTPFAIIGFGEAATETAELRTVNFLPPIQLNFQLPVDYPSKRPPGFTLSCGWLSKTQLSSLCRKLDELWLLNENCEVLFTWTSFLQNDVIQFLSITSPLDLSLVFERRLSVTKRKRSSDDKCDHLVQNEVQNTSRPKSVGDQDSLDHDLPPNNSVSQNALHQDSSAHSSTKHDPRAIQNVSPHALLAVILEHDHAQRQRNFDSTLYTCSICFLEKLGALCTKFRECGHVFCKGCIRDYLEVKIGDGDVAALTCPYEKCETQASPYQVQQLVPDLFVRYDRLLLQTSLDKMSDICYCPRPLCQSPVIREPDETMGLCPRCYFVFCVICRFAYHGKAFCRMRQVDLISFRDNYLTSSLDEQARMKKQYGAKFIMNAVDETMSREWLDEFTRLCPGCGASIQKNLGCNKMTCSKCHCFFCYICGKKLSRTNPYDHYAKQNGDCYGRLFHGMEAAAAGAAEEDTDDEDEYDFLEEFE